jgi:hypothetical protein
MKTYPFNARTRRTIDLVMREMGLLLVSNKRQIENGTLLYVDLETQCLYGFYESGYCRRFVPTTMAWSQAQIVNGIGYQMYQLNRTYMENYIYQHMDGTVYKCRRKRRVLVGPMEQIGIVTAAIANYRINLIK